MRRLFLRFYFGVVAILVAAWLVQSYVMRSREADNARVAVKALAGGVRLARDTVLAAGPDNEAEGLAKANAAFDYPVYIVPASKRPMYPHDEERLREVGVIFYNDRILCRLPPGDRMLELGPLPQFIGPTQGEYFLGYGAVFALAAAAIAVLLRPVASQLRSLERAATEIASGDMSARIRDRRAVGNLAVAVAFNSMADRVESVLRSQRELLQAVSHELRTPLARIRFATELIASAKTEVERAKRLKSVDDATEQLDNLVGELLGYARVDSEVAANRGQRIDLGELVAEVVELHSPLHPNVRFEIDSSAAGEVTADRPSLARALGNLIGNAGKNASEQVEISAELNGEGVVIRVDDDGPGVPPADRERIFEPFVRLASSRAGGVGLGLALVKRIVESRGGRVECKDSPLGGARFEVSLPNGELP